MCRNGSAWWRRRGSRWNKMFLAAVLITGLAFT